MFDEAEFGIDDMSEEEYNRLKEKNIMPKKKKTKRTRKQFGGGFNQPLGGVGARPLGGVRAPVRPMGFKHGKSAKKK